MKKLWLILTFKKLQGRPVAQRDGAYALHAQDLKFKSWNQMPLTTISQDRSPKLSIFSAYNIAANDLWGSLLPLIYLKNVWAEPGESPRVYNVSVDKRIITFFFSGSKNLVFLWLPMKEYFIG